MNSRKANNGVSPSKEIKHLPFGHYDYANSNYADWRPWGLYDHKYIPPPSQAAFYEALDQLKINVRRRATLLTSLRKVAVLYWETRRSVERPPLSWYRKNIQPFRTAARNFLKLLEPETRRELSGLDRRTQIEMNRRLLTGIAGAGSAESIEELLRQFIRVCDRVLQQRREGGRPRHQPVINAVRQTAKIWEGTTGKRMGLSLDTITDERWDFGLSKQVFTYPGPLFVQTILQGIDPTLSSVTIRTALRNVLSKSRKRKL